MATWALPTCFIGTDCPRLGCDWGHLGRVLHYVSAEDQTQAFQQRDMQKAINKDKCVCGGMVH